jgi:uncharacterized protein (DUF58 family)
LTPQLAFRGKLVLCAGTLLTAAGIVSPADAVVLVALGILVLAGLAAAYLAWFPTAIYLRRHKVELAWWIPPGDQPGGAVTTDHPFTLHMALRNRGERPLRVTDVRLFTASALRPIAPFALTVPAGSEREACVTLSAAASGHWVLHGALLKLADLAGLFEIVAYFPSPIGVKVFPRFAAPRAAQLLLRPQVGALHERTGVHTLSRRGLAGDLREIRDHAHGDPFKFIAWKATARRRRLMVRELESEIVVTHQLLVDVAGTMRGRAHGATKLDHAIELGSALARLALEGGDRVGLVTFASRLVGFIKPGEGRPHFLRIVDKLIETKTLVDADLVDMTDGELVAAVARYLYHQEGVDLRISRPPPLSDPAWGRLAAGPRGELYDLAAQMQVVGNLLRQAKITPAPSEAGEIPRLRQFSRVRGLELPYRQSLEPGRRAAGLEAALSKVASAERSQLIVLVSDLEPLLDDAEACLRAIRIAQRRHHQLVVVAPFGPRYGPRPTTSAGRKAAEVFTEDEERRLAIARTHLEGRGIPVLVVGPEDGPDQLAVRIHRSKQTRGPRAA